MPPDRPALKRQQTGIQGENLAAGYLEQQGYRILHRRYRCRVGEIDLIAENNGMIIFVEVKTVRTRAGHLVFAEPEEKIDRGKISSLRQCARHYLASLSDIPDCRFDLITIRLKNSEPEILHLTNILTEDS